jgi:hypothetical protein
MNCGFNPYRYPIREETTKLIVLAGAYTTFASDASQDGPNDIDITRMLLPLADENRRVAELIIFPLQTASLSGSQGLQIIASEADLALADDNAFTDWVTPTTAANQTGGTLILVPTAKLVAAGPLGDAIPGPIRVEMPRNTRFLNIRRDPASNDVTRAATCHIMAVTQKSTLEPRPW